jgi:MFS family permease
MKERPSRIEILRNLRYANLDVAFATAFGTLVSGSFMVGLVHHFGGGDYWIGLLAAIPALAGLMQIPGAIYGRGFPNYKRFVFPGGLAWRLLYLPLIVLPFLVLPTGVALVVIVFCVALASLAVQFVNPIYSDWLAEMVPANSRGWFFSRRNAIAAVAGAGAALAGGLLLDAFRGWGRADLGFALLFGLGAACGLVSLAFYLRMKDMERVSPIRASLSESLFAFKNPIADRRFLPVLVFLAVLIFGQAFAGILFAAFALESLRMSFTVIQVMGLTHALGHVLSVWIWGNLSDRYGNKPIMAILAVGLGLTPVMWLFCFPGNDPWNAVILISGHVFSGFIWGGVGVVQFNLLLATAKPEDRANYIGVGLALQSIIGGLAPLAGATLMASLRGAVPPDVAYKWVFAATIALRFAAVFFLLPVKEEGSVSIRGTLRQLRRVTPGGFMAMQQLTRSADVGEREEAMERVAAQGLEMAADELLKALHDPAPRLRRQAAVSLGRLGDPRAVEALVHQLVEHPDLVEEETIAALGELGHPSAVEPLGRYLHSPRPQLRRAAARAMGQSRCASAVPYLLPGATQAGDPDLRRSALEALRMLGAREGEEVAAVAALDPQPSVRIAAAELIFELELTSAAPALRGSLERFDDDASSEVAYALGVVGGLGDLPRVIATAAKCQSVITRRRCLLGAARMLGVEGEAYRLMLLEGMSRDARLMELLRPKLKRNRGVRRALDRFSAGEEAEALRILAAAVPKPGIEALARQPVEEGFLVAAAAAVRDA